MTRSSGSEHVVRLATVDDAEPIARVHVASWQSAYRRLQVQALPGLVVWVLALNVGARLFYERLGGRLVAERSIAIASHPFVEVAYGWPRTG